MATKLATLTECSGDLPAGIDFLNAEVAVDCEMLGLNLRRDRLCLVQVSDGRGNVWLVRPDLETRAAPNLKRLLEDASLTKIFHFGRYDFASLEHYLGIRVAGVFDTKIASKLCRTYSDKHGLKALCEEFLGVKLDKEISTSYWGGDVLSEEQKHYAASDVLYLHELKRLLMSRLEAVGRVEMAQACFAFLQTRVALDLAGWENDDIFAH